MAISGDDIRALIDAGVLNSPEDGESSTEFLYGTVTALGPLKVLVDGDSRDLAYSPTSFIGFTPLVGSRVVLARIGSELVILGSSSVYGDNDTGWQEGTVGDGIYHYRRVDNIVFVDYMGFAGDSSLAELFELPEGFYPEHDFMTVARSIYSLDTGITGMLEDSGVVSLFAEEGNLYGASFSFPVSSEFPTPYIVFDIDLSTGMLTEDTTNAFGAYSELDEDGYLILYEN